MSTVCLSCILFTLDGHAVEKNQYFSVFLMWLSQLVLKGELQQDDRLVIKIDDPTFQFAQNNQYFTRLLHQLQCKIDFILHPQPKSLLEGMMWKYSTVNYSQDIFMYCDIDVFILKPIHSFTDSIDTDCIMIHTENLPVSDPFFGAAFTQEELVKLPTHLKGINAGKFIIRGKREQELLFSTIRKLNSDIDGLSFVCCEQPFFNKAVYTTLDQLDYQIFDEKDIVMGFRTDLYGQYEKEKDEYFLFDCCGNAGDGSKHFQSMFSTFLMLHSGIF
jgi:hypothetical protein